MPPAAALATRAARLRFFAAGWSNHVRTRSAQRLWKCANGTTLLCFGMTKRCARGVSVRQWYVRGIIQMEHSSRAQMNGSTAHCQQRHGERSRRSTDAIIVTARSPQKVQASCRNFPLIPHSPNRADIAPLRSKHNTLKVQLVKCNLRRTSVACGCWPKSVGLPAGDVS